MKGRGIVHGHLGGGRGRHCAWSRKNASRRLSGSHATETLPHSGVMSFSRYFESLCHSPLQPLDLSFAVSPLNNQSGLNNLAPITVPMT